MTATTLPGTEVAAFAAAVRSALSDLPPDELDELTDGLEADLAERADESGSDLGDPAAYAEELRAAAGYPPRSARGHLGDALPDLRTLPQEIRRRWKQTVKDKPIIGSIGAFFVSLRPVWWVLRGLVVSFLVLTLLWGAGTTNLWPIAVIITVFSVVLGRGWMSGRAGVRWVLRVASAFAIVAAPFVLAWGVNQWNNGYYAYNYPDDSGYDMGTGLTQDGQQIDNIFAYDAEGNPIDQVQLFDQNGKPLNVTSDMSNEWWNAQDGSMLVPSGDVPGRAGWNVYPLAHVNDWSDYEDDGTFDDSEISKTDFPLYKVKPLSGHDAPAGTSDEATAPPAG